MDFIDACKKLISIDSSPSNGTGEACQFIHELSTQMGFECIVEPEVQRGISEANVLCFVGKPEKKVHLILQTHLDTVDPGAFALWLQNGKNPFHASIHNDQLYGLGVADTKLDFLCKLFAAKKYIGMKPKRTFALVGTYGEEHSMNGAIHLIRRKSIMTDKILVSEPTNFNLVYSGKGLANLEITIPFSKEEMQARLDHDSGEGQSTQCKVFKGLAAHSSQPQLGVNSIENMLKFLENLPEQLLILEVDGGTNYNTIPVHSLLEFDLVNIQGVTINQKLIKIYKKINELQNVFNSILDHDFNPPMTTLNIGMIRTYDDHLKIMGCVRLPVAIKEEMYSLWLEELKNYCHDIGAEFRVRDHKKPFKMNKDSEFTQQCLNIIQKNIPEARLTTQPVTNEANVFHKFGIETLAFGPGIREGNSQTAHESISIENLNNAINIYENLIKKICYE
jgi:acetylornithine deacetylase/succinyl-diaminopimelate desuccinylase-like protein